MPRIRSLKPEHRLHRKIGALDHVTYRLWVGMILEADDEGRMVCDGEQLRATIFGYHPKVTTAVVEASLATLHRLNLIKVYAVEGTRYAWFHSWMDHQKISNPTESKLPPYKDSGNLQNFLEDSSLARARGSEGIGKEGKGSERIGEEARTAPAREGESNGQPPVEFEIPESVRQALAKTPILGAIPRVQSPTWWRAQIRAHGRRGVDFAAELLEAEAWIVSNPQKAPKKDHAGFLHRWFKRAGGGDA